jgi:hypothetical protein
MRINLARFSPATALLAALGLMGAFASSASADSLSCEISGSISLFPGLSETPTVQSVKITNPGAKMTNCTGTETVVTAGSVWVKGLGTRTKEAITCKALTGTGAALEKPERGVSAEFRWHPKIPGGGKFNGSGGFLNVPITEMSVSLSGAVSTEFPKDAFQGDKIAGSVTEKYSGTCGGSRHGKGKVTKGTFAGTITIS